MANLNMLGYNDDMDFLQSIFVGAVQGITEFLPISSTAHLILVPKFFGWPDLGLKLDTALHFGTALAILLFFAKDWISIIKLGVGCRVSGKKAPDSRLLTPNSQLPANLLWQIIVGSIPAAIAGFLIEGIVEDKLYQPWIIVLTLAIFGVLIWIVDKKATAAGSIKDVGYKQSLAVGLAQTVALVPGVSRSGITMIAARMIGLSRSEAARFSFLLSTPAILGAFGLMALKLTASDLTPEFILAVTASAIFGYFAIKYLLKYLQKSDFTIFAVYRIILALVVLFVLVL